MIFDNKKNISLYRGLSENIDKAFDSFDLISTGIPGRNIIDEETLYFNLVQITTAPAKNNNFEAHKKYIDIHFIIEGEELMEFSNISNLSPITEYDVSGDFALYTSEKDENHIVCHSGDFYLVFPEDAHKPNCCVNNPGLLKKAIFKVLI